MQTDQPYRRIWIGSSDHHDPTRCPQLSLTYTEGTVHYYIKDHLGNIRVTENQNREVVSAEDYYPFGLTMPRRSYNSGNTDACFKFTGKELDREQGVNLYYFGARYYDPSLGKWYAVDPLAEKYLDMSPYNYTMNNPLIFVDLHGDSIDVAGDKEQALQFVQSIVPEEYRGRITTDEDGQVFFDTDGLDLSGDIGLQLANAMINGKEKYLVAVQNTVTGVNRNTGESVTYRINSGTGIENFSITPRNFDGGAGGQGLMPIKGYDGQITFAEGSWQYSSTDTRIQPISNIAFHEFMENYNRTVNKMPYIRMDGSGAHRDAINKASKFKLQIGPAGFGKFIPRR